MSFVGSPTEILTKIFLLLGVRDLVICRQVFSTDLVSHETHFTSFAVDFGLLLMTLLKYSITWSF